MPFNLGAVKAGRRLLFHLKVAESICRICSGIKIEFEIPVVLCRASCSSRNGFAGRRCRRASSIVAEEAKHRGIAVRAHSASAASARAYFAVHEPPDEGEANRNAGSTSVTAVAWAVTQERSVGFGLNIGDVTVVFVAPCRARHHKAKLRLEIGWR